MSRRPNPDRIVTARREAQLARMRSAGVPSADAVAMLRDIEQTILARGLDRSDRAFWDVAGKLVDERVRR